VPCRLRDLRKRAGDYGVELVADGKGPHPWKFKRTGDRNYPIPAHKGLNTEVPDEYVRGLCRNFNIDRDDFLSGL
jgi:hypothetical protein